LMLFLFNVPLWYGRMMAATDAPIKGSGTFSQCYDMAENTLLSALSLSYYDHAKFPYSFPCHSLVSNYFARNVHLPPAMNEGPLCHNRHHWACGEQISRRCCRVSAWDWRWSARVIVDVIIQQVGSLDQWIGGGILVFERRR
jgi:hypothetical protein